MIIIIVLSVLAIISLVVGWLMKGVRFGACIAGFFVLASFMVGLWQTAISPNIAKVQSVTEPIVKLFDPLTKSVGEFIPNLFASKDDVEKTVKDVKDTGIVDKVVDTVKGLVSDLVSDKKSLEEHLVSVLSGEEDSSVEKGAVKYGATFVMGDLDELGRATFAHILVSDDQEPGQNGEKRESKITYDPSGWHNYRIKNVWVNDRTHLIGYQFSGITTDSRNLVYGTAYLNRGTEGSGSDETVTSSMLYYEQLLDSWLANHPHYKLDYYVKPLYHGDDLVPYAVYMQWVGVDENGNQLAIKIGGKSKLVTDSISAVILENVSPSYQIDYATGLLK